jgi:hypothetical protein
MASRVLFRSGQTSRFAAALRPAGLVAAGLCLLVASADTASAQQAYGGQSDYIRPRNYPFPASDWNRFYHYPYVFYPHNYYADAYMQSAEDLYYRYPQEMRVPVYNRRWQNYYPKARRYHQGHHFNLDVF